MATALIASTLLTGGLAAAVAAVFGADVAAALAGSFAGAAFGGAAFGGAALAAGFGAGFFGGGVFAFDLAADLDAVALFDAITVLCAARQGRRIAKKGQRRRHPFESRPEVWAGLIKPRLTLDQPAKAGLFPVPPRCRRARS
jgi:hypothetical protein